MPPYILDHFVMLIGKISFGKESQVWLLKRTGNARLIWGSDIHCLAKAS